MLLTLASCCGPDTTATPASILPWAIAALCCAVLLMGLSLCVLIALRRRGSIPWRHAGVLVPAGLAALALVLAQGAWAAYQASQVTDRAAYSDYDWYTHLTAQAQLFGTLGLLLAACTLLTLVSGAAYLIMDRD